MAKRWREIEAFQVQDIWVLAMTPNDKIAKVRTKM